jgi:CO dehydrogenase maturation factor
MRVAVAGKGGSGKSTVAGTMARMLARRGDKVLVIDTDPLPGLAVSLGMGPLDAALLEDAVERNEGGRWRLRKGIGAARAVQRYSVEGPDGVRLLQFGKASAEGLGPVTGSLSGLYQLVHRLARDKVLDGWHVIGDMPAGPRQTAFNWAPYTKTIVVVVEPTWQSVLTARRIVRIARMREGAHPVLVANKVKSDGDIDEIERRMNERPLTSVPADPEARAADEAGVALFDHAPASDAVRSIEELVKTLERDYGVEP